ncbi:glutamate racemase [Thermospira aquatica]|uniref:Glutamate racemase n=1 Tax=Thermospira aquatica TaxID=2828656 RepID=A0AAX3BAA2_9SPIR|nr:glutamate racemase [Thermospira aquatica]URA09185.1 glutamate racemase [Thermospira aquatica]
MGEMRYKPIGVFDSGVGGLTVVKALMELLPSESFVYLGDTANLPYGEKSAEMVRQYAFHNAQFLQEFDIKVMVVACNTASSVALEELQENFDFPVLGVIEPAAREAVRVSRSQQIGVIGTKRTIRSEMYTHKIHELSPQARVIGKACPLFVPLIEEGFLHHEATMLVAKEYLSPLANDIDTLILGCTHYPLIRDTIQSVLPHVTIVDSATSTARELRQLLLERDWLSDQLSPKRQFFATDITEHLHGLARMILPDVPSLIFEEVRLASTPVV